MKSQPHTDRVWSANRIIQQTEQASKEWIASIREQKYSILFIGIDKKGWIGIVLIHPYSTLDYNYYGPKPKAKPLRVT